MPGQAALLVFLAGAAGARGIYIFFGRAEGVSQARPLAGKSGKPSALYRAVFADAVLKANLVGIAPLDQLVHWLEGI